jgi:putative ABC transport system permease protein
MPERIYRFFLLVYPRAFRESHGAELLDVFRNCHRDSRGEKLGSLIVFWLGTVWDAISNGFLMRLEHAGGARVGDFEIPNGSRSGWSVGWTKDLRYALRQLVRSPGFSLTVVLTLALGVGANAAVFSLVYCVLIAPLPFSEPQRTVVLSEHAPGVDSSLVSPVTYTDWSERSRSFDELAAFRFWENRAVELSPDGSTAVLQVTATPNFFRALGWQPVLGRTYREEDPAGVNEAVLSHRLWVRAFHGDPDVLGKTVRVSGTPFTVVGVMPPAHDDPAIGLGDIWTPLHRYNIQVRRASSFRERYLGVVGRLKSGIGLGKAQDEMSALQSQLANESTSVAKGFVVRLELLTEVAARRARPVLLALFVAVFFVLAIACANVANLILTRAAGRAREYAVRIALGARRFHLARQLLTESLLLSSLGGAAGLLIAYWTVEVLRAGLADRIPRAGAVSLNLPVVTFAGLLVFLIGLVFSLAPLTAFGSGGLHQTLKEAGRGGGLGRGKLRQALVAAQVAFTVLLLCSAGLVLRSFGKLLSVDPGFSTANRIVADVILPQQDYAPEGKRTEYFRDLFRRLREHPEFSKSGAALYFPCRPKVWFSTVWVEGSTVEPGLEPIVAFNLFAGDYFEAMGIPLKQGRLAAEEELWTNRDVVLVNETMSRQLFRAGEVVGRRFKTSRSGRWSTVIGVVGDVHQSGLEQAPRPEFYVPFSSMPMQFLTLVLTSRGAPDSAISTLRTVAREGAPGLQIENASGLSGLVENTLTLRRLALVLIGLFALLSLALAGIGTYGVISFTVAQRKSEVGLRIALGASGWQVLRMITAQGLRTTGAGIAAGLAIMAFASPAIRFLLYDVPPLDPAVYAVAPLPMLAVAALVCLIPARRAAKTDPLVSLRGD